MELFSRLDLHSVGRNYVVTRAKRINPRQVDVEGSDINLIVGSTSFMANAVQRQNIEGLNKLLLDGAFGDDLDRYAWDRYQLPRKGASAALTSIECVRPTAAAGGGSIPIGEKVLSLDGIEYVLYTEALFGPSTLSATAFVRAAQAGKEFQVGANQLRRFERPDQLFDKTITVNNPEAAAGGEPAENDDVFKERVRGFWTAARRGTLGAIEFGALQVPGVDSAQAFEALDDNRPDRFVELFIADSSGVASQALANKVDIALNEYRAGGIYVAIFTSRPLIIDIAVQPVFRAGVDTNILGTQIKTAIIDYVNSLQVNQPFLVHELGAVLSRFKNDGLIAKQSTLVSPVGDLYPDVGFTLRTREENVEILTPLLAGN